MVPATSMSPVAEELERLARLRNNGDISAGEYEALKAHVIKEATTALKTSALPVPEVIHQWDSCGPANPHQTLFGP